MRKFRFIGDSKHCTWEIQNPRKDCVYTIQDIRLMSNNFEIEEKHIIDWIKLGTWEEVFDEPRLRTVTVSENQRIGFEETYPTSSCRFLTKDQILPDTNQNSLTIENHIAQIVGYAKSRGMTVEIIFKSDSQ
jgi:hypothetical protein